MPEFEPLIQSGDDGHVISKIKIAQVW